MDIASLLKEVESKRKAKKLSIEDMAAALNMNRTTYSYKLKSHTFTVPELINLCHEADLSVFVIPNVLDLGKIDPASVTLPGKKKARGKKL